MSNNFTFAPTVLYQLASPSTPDSAIDEAIETAESGQPVTTSTRNLLPCLARYNSHMAIGIRQVREILFHLARVVAADKDSADALEAALKILDIENLRDSRRGLRRDDSDDSDDERAHPRTCDLATAAGILGCSHSHIRKLCKDGMLGFRKKGLGGKYVIFMYELQHIQTVTPRAEQAILTDREWWSVPEAAALLGVAVHKIRELVTAGRLGEESPQGRGTGPGKYRIRREELAKVDVSELDRKPVGRPRKKERATT